MPDMAKHLPTILASIGLVLATSSFISGVQLVRSTKGTVEGKIHRFNGYVSITLFTTLAVLWVADKGVGFWSIAPWVSGILFIFLKISIVRKRGRAFKYVSWMGVTIIFMWLYIIYRHIPI